MPGARTFDSLQGTSPPYVAGTEVCVTPMMCMMILMMVVTLMIIRKIAHAEAARLFVKHASSIACGAMAGWRLLAIDMPSGCNDRGFHGSLLPQAAASRPGVTGVCAW
jgi:hypothetical protein